jgi:hypothetical protein
MGKKLLKWERIVRYLENGMGLKRVPTQSKKYMAYERKDRPGVYYFVGKAGALRTGKTASDSLSLSLFADYFWKNLERWEEENA